MGTTVRFAHFQQSANKQKLNPNTINSRAI